MILDLIQLFMQTHHRENFHFLLTKINKSAGLTFENVQYLIEEAIQKRKISTQAKITDNVPNVFRKTGLNLKSMKKFLTFKKTLSSEQ